MAIGINLENDDAFCDHEPDVIDRPVYTTLIEKYELLRTKEDVCNLCIEISFENSYGKKYTKILVYKNKKLKDVVGNYGILDKNKLKSIDLEEPNCILKNDSWEIARKLLYIV